MIENTSIPAQQNENLQAFLRYLPRRIAAFEQRILRYRLHGWDLRGMAVLSGDARRLAEASGRYGLLETHENLLMLAQMVGEHFASMRTPDPQQAKRMFALLSAATRSLASHLELQPRSASAETDQKTDVQRVDPDAPNAHAMPPPILEEIAPTVASIETAALVEPEELIEPPTLMEPVAAEEPAAADEPDEPTAQVEAIEAIEPPAPDELVASVELAQSVEPIELIEQDESSTTGEIGMRRVYHLSDGNAFAIALGQRLESEGYAIESVADIDELSELLKCLMPQLLLVDASHMSDLAAIGTLRHDAQQRSQPHRRIQMVVMAAQDSMDMRRAAHRAGADLLLFPPYDIIDLSDRLQALHASVAAEKLRVLIVEDDRVDALFAQAVLTRAGMQAQVEHDPMRVLEALTSLRPDLVLMDLHMPFANGVEVTMVIREHPLFARLPIVFLSGESDPDSRLEAINAGGDDFLFKPIRPRHLIAAVQDRVRRLHPVNKQVPTPGASNDPAGA